VGVDQRPHPVLAHGRVAGHDARRRLVERGDDVRETRVVDVDARAGRALLAGEPERRARDGSPRRQVACRSRSRSCRPSRRCTGAASVPARTFARVHADLVAAGEYARDAGSGIADRRPPGHEVERARRHAGVAEREREAWRSMASSSRASSTTVLPVTSAAPTARPRARAGS
jgi:hypothetical protein